MATRPVRVEYEAWAVWQRGTFVNEHGHVIYYHHEDDAERLAQNFKTPARPARVRVTVEEITDAET